MRRQAPENKQSPPDRSTMRNSYRLPPVTPWGVLDYEDWMIAVLGYDGEIRFLKRGGSEGNEVCDGRVGSTMLKGTNARRSYLGRFVRSCSIV